MIETDTTDLKKYVNNLKRAAVDAYPKAVRSTLERMGFETTKEYKANVRKNLTIRGDKKANIVVASIGYEKPSGSLKINDMQCIVGQRSMMYGKKTEQLKKQEFGEPIVSKTKYTVKPTKFSRDNSYKKLVVKDVLMARLNVKTIGELVKHPADNAKAQFRQAQGVAHHKKNIIYFLPDTQPAGTKRGIFRLSDNEKPKLMYSFKGKTQPLRARPMLERATQTVSSKSDEIFVKEAERRIAKELAKGLKP